MAEVVEVVVVLVDVEEVIADEEDDVVVEVGGAAGMPSCKRELWENIPWDS